MSKPEAESTIPVLMALGALRRADAKKYDALMKSLGVDSYQHLNPDQFGDVIARCSALVGDAERPTVDEIADAFEDDPPTQKTVRDALNGMALDRAAPKGNGLNLDEVAKGETTVSGALNAMGSLANSARKLGHGF